MLSVAFCCCHNSLNRTLIGCGRISGVHMGDRSPYLSSPIQLFSLLVLQHLLIIRVFIYQQKLLKLLKLAILQKQAIIAGDWRPHHPNGSAASNQTVYFREASPFIKRACTCKIKHKISCQIIRIISSFWGLRHQTPNLGLCPLTTYQGLYPWNPLGTSDFYSQTLCIRPPPSHRPSLCIRLCCGCCVQTFEC